MITFADLQRIYRSEKSSTGLEKIDEGFYSEVRELQSKIEEEHREYVGKITLEIFERRKNKIVMSALRSSGPGEKGELENMTPLEKVFYLDIQKALNKYKTAAFSETGKESAEVAEEIEKIKQAKIRIRFLSEIPSIIGSDMVHYGPFKEGDVADIPAGNAKILIEQEIAEEA